MMRGMAMPEAPEALIMTPKAIPRRAIHHSFTILMTAKMKITNPAGAQFSAWET